MSERVAQAEHTRERILEAAAAQMYRVGYQATSTAAVLDRLGISKGALYHHFPGKQALGYAVLDEYLAPRHARCWDDVLEAERPLDAIIEHLECQASQMCSERMRHGCPINNLAQEMSPLDEGFRERVDRIYRHWRRTLERALAAAADRGQMRPEVDPAATAALIVAATQGAVGLVKNSLDEAVFRQALAGLLGHLRAVRRPPA